MSDGRLQLTRRILPAAITALVFAGMVALHANSLTLTYKAILEWWGVDAYSSPFVDIETVLSAVRCLNQGVDVFATNPCDPVRRVFDYSPLWLLLTKLPVTEAWTTPAGLLVDLSFIASLILLPAGRSSVATIFITLGILSSAVVFGMERGNNDLVLFVLAAAAAALVCRRDSLRFLGYAVALLAGLLKYYPMTLMMMATRERPARFFVIAAASLAVVALFLATMGHELTRALKLIPAGGWFGDMFGSTTLPGGLGREYGWPAGSTAALRWGLMMAAFGVGAALAWRQRIGGAVERLTDHERMALLAGGLLMLSCFFTAQNIGYRAMHLVLTLPALTALVRMRAGRVWLVTTGAVLALLWCQAWRNWYFPQDAGRAMFIRGWMIRELLWWWTISMLIALVLAIIVRSEMGRRALGRLAPRPSAEAAAVS